MPAAALQSTDATRLLVVPACTRTLAVPPAGLPARTLAIPRTVV